MPNVETSAQPKCADTPSRWSRVAEEWFLDHGLPAFVSTRTRRSGFLSRTAPLGVFVVVSQVALLIASALVSYIVRSPQFEFLDAYLTEASSDQLPQGSTFAEIVALSTLLVPIIGILGAIIAAWWVSLLNPTQRSVVGCIALVIFLLAPIAARAFVDFSGVFSSSALRMASWLGIRFALVLAVYFALRVGAGSVLAFAWRRARHEVAAMAPLSAKALPLLLLTFLFAFFSAETWQVAVGLSLPRLISVVAILVVLSLVLVIASTMERVDGAVRDGVAPGRARELLTDTPFATASAGLSGIREDTCLSCVLSRAERGNLVLVQAMVQLWQSIAFAVLVFGSLVGLSIAAIPAGTEAQWTQTDPGYIVLNEIRLPVTVAYLKVSALLSAVSVLSFAGASATADSFTQSVMNKLHDEVDRALAIKACLKGEPAT